MLFFFYLIATLIVLSALSVVLFRNPLHGAISLVVTMVGVAILFAMLEAHFLAVVQIIVYAGAIIVLILFVLMLLNVKKENINALPALTWISVFFSAAIFLYFLLPFLNSAFKPIENHINFTAVDTQVKAGTVKAIGELLYSKYVFTFESCAILLMVALVGAVMVGSRSIHKGSK